ncbi:IS110 family RNA-guided transposase, partial [Levilactobacillus suantsaiihabitans]|uniref:IS110 family transposase n=1 Tax=Levilactobacillus suantsaiihabitans TaxID=2487722 RepID=UPI0014368025
IPGHKTDKKDARWIAKLLRLDLIPASFVPDETIQDLRDLTRARKHLIESRNKQKNRIHQVLQCGGVKLTTYIEDIFGKSGRNMLELLANGEVITSELVKPLVYTTLKKKVPQIVDAMNGFMRAHHRFMLNEILRLIDTFDASIAEYEARIDILLQQYEAEVSLLISFKGIQRESAGIILAEIGTDMSVFEDEKHLASWAGLCPGNRESAGKRHNSKINHGNAYLKRILCQASWAAAKSKEGDLGAFFRLKRRQRGPKKAAVATAHRMLKQIYFALLTHQESKKHTLAATSVR